jgi:hypothetical protein
MGGAGDNLIAAWCADLGELDQQIEDLQKAKRDVFKSIREDHGRVLADAVKNALRLSRLTEEQMSTHVEIDAEADRILRIIEASRGRATRVRTREGEKSTAARKDVQQGRRGPGVGEPTTEQSGLAMPSSREIGRPPMSPAGTQALPVDTPSGAEPAIQVEVPSGEAAVASSALPAADTVALQGSLPGPSPAGDGTGDGGRSAVSATALEPVASLVATQDTVVSRKGADAVPEPDARTSIQRTVDEVLIKRGARPEHCLHPDCCGSSTPRALCFTCRMAREEAEAA